MHTHMQALATLSPSGFPVLVDPRLPRNQAGRMPCNLADFYKPPGLYTLLLPTTDLQVCARLV